MCPFTFNVHVHRAIEVNFEMPCEAGDIGTIIPGFIPNFVVNSLLNKSGKITKISSFFCPNMAKSLTQGGQQMISAIA